MKNKKTFKPILIIIVALFIVTSISFALYKIFLQGSNINKVTSITPDFKFNYTESNDVTLTNPTLNDEGEEFNFSITGSTQTNNYIFNINYTIYIVPNANNTISNENIMVQLFDNSNNAITQPQKVSQLSLINGSTNKYIINTSNMRLSRQLTNNYILKFWYGSSNNITTFETTNSTTASASIEGTYQMKVNVKMNNYNSVHYNYTNLVLTAEDFETNAIYNNGLGYKEKTYISTSIGGKPKDISLSITQIGLIHHTLVSGDIIRIKGGELAIDNDYCRFIYYDENKTYFAGNITDTAKTNKWTSSIREDGVQELLLKSSFSPSPSYFAVSIVPNGEEIILTINEDIITN